MSLTKVPKQQNMIEGEEPVEDMMTGDELLIGGGFSMDLDKEFNRCCQFRICCIQSGCHESLDWKCQYLCLRLNCKPFKFDLDTDFNGCCQFRLLCLQSGCHQPCFEPKCQYLCLRCQC